MITLNRAIREVDAIDHEVMAEGMRTIVGIVVLSYKDQPVGWDNALGVRPVEPEMFEIVVCGKTRAF